MSATTGGYHKHWQPPELGLPRAVLAALVVLALIFGFIYVGIVVLAPKPQPEVIQVTQAQLTSLPKPKPPPPPPPPPKVIPPPKPLPAITKPPPIPSKIVVPTKVPPHVHRQPPPRPMRRVETPTPVPPRPQPTPPPAASPPAPPTSGIPIYERAVHDIIQSDQDVPPALQALCVSGTAYIRITISPSGSVLSAVLARSSGVPLIDQTALAHTLHAPLHAFNNEMPQASMALIVPVEIEPSNCTPAGGDDSDDSGQ